MVARASTTAGHFPNDESSAQSLSRHVALAVADLSRIWIDPVEIDDPCPSAALAGSTPRSWPNDYDVIHGGEIVGRVYRMNAGRVLWRWTIRLHAPTPAPNGGVADTLYEAKAPFRAAWEAGGGSQKLRRSSGRMSLGRCITPARDSGDG